MPSFVASPTFIMQLAVLKCVLNYGETKTGLHPTAVDTQNPISKLPKYIHSINVLCIIAVDRVECQKFPTYVFTSIHLS